MRYQRALSDRWLAADRSRVGSAPLCSQLEATAQIKKGLALLAGVRDAMMRRRAEFELQLTLRSVLTSATGPSVLETWRRSL
jgi:hypothetical protein